MEKSINFFKVNFINKKQSVQEKYTDKLIENTQKGNDQTGQT